MEIEKRIIIEMPSQNREKALEQVAGKISQKSNQVVNVNGDQKWAMPEGFLHELIVAECKSAYIINKAKLFFDIYVLKKGDIYLGFSTGEQEKGKAEPTVVSAKKFIENIEL